MKPGEPLRLILVAVVCLVLGFAGGIHRGARQPGGGIVAGSTFSRVDYARSLLQDERRQFTTEWSRRFLAARKARRTAPASDDTTADQLLAELESEILNYVGTGQELVLRHYWLSATAGLGRSNQWLDAYLQMVYQQPDDHELVRRSAMAITFGRATGRQEEVDHALAHLRGIPDKYLPPRPDLP